VFSILKKNHQLQSHRIKKAKDMTRHKKVLVIEAGETPCWVGALGHEQSKSGKVMNTLDRFSGGQWTVGT